MEIALFALRIVQSGTELNACRVLLGTISIQPVSAAASAYRAYTTTLLLLDV